MRRQEKAKQALGRQEHGGEESRSILITSIIIITGVSPAQETQLAGAVFVHDDAHGQGDGRQQEGTHGEGQVQHLVLVLADGPVIHLQVLLGFGFGGVGAIEAG